MIDRQASRILGLGLLVWVTLAGTGCGQSVGPLVNLANSLYPPVDAADKQLAAVESATAGLGGLSSALLYAAVSTQDLQTRLPGQISAGAVSATDITVSLGDQEVVLRAGFDVESVGEQLRVLGKAEVHCAAAIENSVLVLRPAVSRLVVERIDYRGEKTAEALLPTVNAALATFLDNLNGAILDEKIPLNARFLQVVDPALLLKGLSTVSSVTTRPIDLNVALGRSAVFIDPDGIHVLADAVVLSQQRILKVLGELKSLAASPAGSTFSSEQLALLSECGDRPLPQDEEMKTLQAACAALLPRIAPAAAAAPSAGDLSAVHAALALAVPRLRQQFLDKAGLVDSKENLAWNRSALALSRASLAADLNEVLSQAQAAVSLTFPHFDGDVKQTIFTDPAPDLKCTENAGGCDSDFVYPPYSPRGCDSDCTTNNCTTVFGARICVPGLDLACQARKVDCERLKEQERLQYEAAKSAAKATFDAAKAACELVKAAKQAGCQINQGWLESIGGKDVGEIQVRWAEDDGEIDLTVNGIAVGDDLGSLKVHGSVGASTLLGADFNLVPHNVGTVLCVAQWSGRVHAKARVAPMSFELAANLVGAANTADKVTLTFDLAGLPVQLTLDPPPLVALVSQNPQVALACPVPSLVVAAIAAQAQAFNPVASGAVLKLDQTALNDRVDIQLPARQIALEIPSRTLAIGLQSITLVPRWQPRSLVIHD